MPTVVDATTSERYPHMSAALAETLGTSGSTAPAGPDGEIFIRFIGPEGTFKPVPYYEVFNGTWRQSRGPDFFRGKTVLIGTVSSLTDRPLTPLGNMAGTEVLLQAAQAMAAGNWIRHWSEGTGYVFKTILSLLLVLAIWKFGARRALIVFVVEAVVWVASPSDMLDIFFAPNANQPSWTFEASVTTNVSQQLQVLSASFVLPGGPSPAIRAQWRQLGNPQPCAAGTFNDRDDLVFAIVK